MRIFWTCLAFGLIATANQAMAASPARPDIARCPNRPTTGEEGRSRISPLPVPPQLAGIVRSNRDNFAIITFTGRTLCVDASWMNSIKGMTLSPDGRFLSFDWDGYEAWGHVIVDRTGAGQQVDTGVPPVYSPSRRRLAAADLSESAFGELSAFGVWQVEQQGIRELAKIEQMPERMTDWRIDRWSDENCIELSAVTFEEASTHSRRMSRARRDHYLARPGTSGWIVEDGVCPRA